MEQDEQQQEQFNENDKENDDKASLLCQYEKERTDKRNELVTLYNTYNEIGIRMKQIENDLLKLDEVIDQIEYNNIHNNYNNNDISNDNNIHYNDVTNDNEKTNYDVSIKAEAVAISDTKTTTMKAPSSSSLESTKVVVKNEQEGEVFAPINNAPSLPIPPPPLNQEESLCFDDYNNDDNDNYYSNDNDDNDNCIITEFTPTQRPLHLEQQHHNTSTTITTSNDSHHNDNKNGIVSGGGTIESLQFTTKSATKPVAKSTSKTNTTKKYPWTDQIYDMLHSLFHIPSFRDYQREIIDATLCQEDVFVIMRTGGGKSLTYQLPALYELLYAGPAKKITFVVSPLLSLIQDQVDQMNCIYPNSAISFTSSSSSSSSDDTKKRNSSKAVFDAIQNPMSGICLVFITPEKVHQSKQLCNVFEKLYQQGRLARFVIDECHCGCQWGHDFRPDYTKLGKLKYHFPTIPILAVTATASQRVCDDVCTILNINTPSNSTTNNNYKYFRSSANRPNLKYTIVPKRQSSSTSKATTSDTESTIIDMVEFIKQFHPTSAGIVYTYSKKDSDHVADLLCTYGIIARSYHSDISVKQKELIHRSWMKNQTQVVVATIAFGLGINKPDVRFVLHHTISKTLEAYYQESGRAGRDGQPADCVLYYSPKDFTRLLKMVHGTSSERLLLPMVRYAQASGNDALCKAIILKHLGEPDCPDVHQVEIENEGITTYRRDVGIHAKTVVQLLHLRITQGSNVTANMLVKDWRTIGANTPDFVKENSPSKDGLSADDCDRIIISLILENVLQTNPVWNAYDTVIYLKLGPVGDRLIMSTDPKIVVKLPIPPENGDDAKTPKTKASKQAASRKSIPSNGGWLSAKSSNGKATTTTKKKAKTTAKKKVVKKKKAANSKTPKTSKKAATTKKTTARAAKTSEAANQMVIELLSDDDDASYESENEFDE